MTVDPKYTSQSCSKCGFSRPDDRKTQPEFECVSCGHQDNAARNGAVSPLARIEPSYANASAVMLA